MLIINITFYINICLGIILYFMDQAALKNCCYINIWHTFQNTVQLQLWSKSFSSRYKSNPYKICPQICRPLPNLRVGNAMQSYEYFSIWPLIVYCGSSFLSLVHSFRTKFHPQGVSTKSSVVRIKVIKHKTNESLW